MAKCEDCKYWEYTQKDGDDEPVGICRRYAPRGMFLRDTDICFEWPRVSGQNDWCGEFEAKGEVGWSEIIWSARLRSIFRYYGIESFEQLTNYTESDLLRMKRFGMCCLNEVADVLSKRGLSFKNYDKVEKESKESSADAAVREALGIDGPNKDKK